MRRTTGADEPTEVELTLRVHPDAAPRLLRDPLLLRLKHGPQRTHRLVSTYFDTADLRLQRERAALRVRRIGARRIQTFKLAPRPEDGVLARREWEREVTGDTPDFGTIDDRHIRRLLDGDVRDRLAPIFTTEIKRWTLPLKLDGSVIEFALDIGEIRTQRASTPVCEAELELKSGRVESLYKLAQQLNRRVGLAVEPLSKSERGYALLTNRTPGPRRAESIRLTKKMGAGEAFRIVLRSCLLHLRANEASVRAAAGADSVHQLRVAVRRLRSALVAFEDLMAADERRRLSKSVRWIAQECGRARELDVFMTGALDPLIARMPSEESLRRLAALVGAASEEAYAAVTATLDSRQYTEILLALEGWVEGGRWSEGRSETLDTPVREFARAALKRLHRKLVGGIDRIEALDEAGLHELRIRIKRLRYASEFFRGLFRPKAVRPYLDAVTAIQDRLGSLNDGAVARDIVAGLERQEQMEPAMFARAAGLVLGWNASRVAADLRRLPADWRRFRAVRPFWK